VYWTEWGSTPRVARMSISGSSGAEQRVGPNNLKWPNALFVSADNKLYVADGHPTKPQLFKCSLPGPNQFFFFVYRTQWDTTSLSILDNNNERTSTNNVAVGLYLSLTVASHVAYRLVYLFYNHSLS